MEKETYNVGTQTLRAWMQECFLAAGFAQDAAASGAEVLLMADLRGIDSHGCARLPGYIRLAENGRINTGAKPHIVRETPSTATLDADGGLGLWVARLAMETAIEKAQNCGTGWVATANSSHFGIAGYHAEMALAHRMIGLSCTNASPLVAPAGSRQAYLGTNPIAVAIPAGKHRPFLMDMATATAANGKLEIAQRTGKNIPEGWVQTKEGQASTNPTELQNGGTLLPLGSHAEGGYHKGYGLGATVDILSGVLSGANFGAWVPPFVPFLDVKEEVGDGIGHFFGAMRIDGFMEPGQFLQRMDKWIEGAKSLPTVEGTERVLIPGEPEFASQQHRLKAGIPLNPKVWENLEALAAKLGVPTLAGLV